MSKEEHIILRVALFLSIVVAVVLTAIMITQESRKDAYDRGKIDGELLVFEKWAHDSDEKIDLLVDCIHLRAIYVLDSLPLIQCQRWTLPRGQSK